MSDETQALTESGVALVLRHLRERGELKRREVQRLLGQKRRAAGVLDAVADAVVASGQAVKVAAPHGSWRLRWSLSRADDALAAVTDDEAATTEQRRAVGPGPFRRAGTAEAVVRELVRTVGGSLSADQRRAARQAITRLEELGAR